MLEREMQKDWRDVERETLEPGGRRKAEPLRLSLISPTAVDHRTAGVRVHCLNSRFQTKPITLRLLTVQFRPEVKLILPSPSRPRALVPAISPSSANDAS